MPRRLPSLLVLAMMVAPARAQKGDRAGETQGDLPTSVAIPEAPVRSAAEALAAFRVAPGLEVTLVAAEPLIGDPVQAVFDERGRLWVVEMRGYMRDVDAKDEGAPLGRIVVLRDRDGDGAMDESLVFQDGLVLPRAIGVVEGGVLVLEPPHLWFLPDADGDLRPEGRKLVASGFDAGIRNPEHAANGLVRGLDNWIECANWGVRLRWRAGAAEREDTFTGGQWGVCFDDFGRRYYDYNSDFLRMDVMPGGYARRWPAVPVAPLWNLQVVKDQSTWPIRPTPGVNRGYQKDQLRADLTLRTCTAACAPYVDRGGLLPEPYAGSAFVCEPAGNLVARFRLEDAGLGMRGVDPEPGKPFLASTDERFRPVNLGSGPDGALYVVDMYRGVIQHRNFVTTFLRKQIVARALERPIGLGRIWRVAPPGAVRSAHFDLRDLDSRGLVARLANPNGFVRDQAQRLLVERGSEEVRAPLEALVATGSDARVRLQAFWTLEGLGRVSPLTLTRVLADESPALRAAGLRVLERDLARPDPRPALRLLEPHLDDPSASVRIQATLSLGAVVTLAGTEGLARQALRYGAEPGMATAIATGCRNRAASLLRAIETQARETGTATAAARPVLELLARTVATARDRLEAQACASFALTSQSAAPILDALERGLPQPPGDCSGLLASPESAELAERLLVQRPRLAAAFTPKRGAEARFTAGHERRRRDGAELYGRLCSSCHQQDGRGLAGLAPSLHDAPLLQAPADRAIRIVLHGLAGPLEVGGETWNLAMPGQPTLDDAEVAAIVTFVRGEYGRREESVDPTEVRALRERYRERASAWSAAELQDTSRR